MPISAVMVGDRVARTLIDEGGEFFHGFTYLGHPVACAVALENLRILRDEGMVERVRDDIGPYFQGRLRELEDHQLVGEVRGVGLIAGIELVRYKDGPVFFEPEGHAGVICRDHCIRSNVILRAVRDGMVTAPPLVITNAEVDRLVDTVRRSIDLTQADLGL